MLQLEKEIIDNEYLTLFLAVDGGKYKRHDYDCFSEKYLAYIQDGVDLLGIASKMPNALWKKIVNHSEFQGFEPYSIRTFCIHEYAFAVPSDPILKILKSYSPLIEMGAGSGYWAYLLTKLKCDIIPYDGYPPSKKSPFGKKNEWFTREWMPIKKGFPKLLTSFTNRNLFLCWADYDTPFGYECVKNFKGKYALIITEGEGGCIGDDAFHRYLDKHYEELETHGIHNWYGIHDYLAIYKRKKSK